MTLAIFRGTPIYAATVLYPCPARKNPSYHDLRLIVSDMPKRPPLKKSAMGWIVPFLTLLGTAGAMWFVVTDGWFQLVGLWGR